MFWFPKGFRSTCEQLHRSRQRPPHQRLAAFAPGPLAQPHHPRQPTKSRHVAWPQQEVERQPVEGRDRSSQPCRQAVVYSPTVSQEIYAQLAPKQVREAKERQRLRQRQQQVNERERVKGQLVPPGRKGQAAVVERVPKRQLALPEAFPVEVGHWVTEHPEIAEDKGGASQEHGGKGRSNQEAQKQGKPTRGQPVVGYSGPG